jgi:hypothetical protein
VGDGDCAFRSTLEPALSRLFHGSLSLSLSLSHLHALLLLRRAQIGVARDVEGGAEVLHGGGGLGVPVLVGGGWVGGRAGGWVGG